MKEYIEREAAIEAVLGLTIVDPAVAQYANAVYFILHNLPVADVAPVRHGRWNDINPTMLNPGVNWVCRCSLCGCPQDYKHNYCPNCGAPMTDEAVDMMLERWREALE